MKKKSLNYNARFRAQPSSATPILDGGFAPLTVSGATATLRALAGTNKVTRTPRVGYVSAASVGAVISIRQTLGYIFSSSSTFSTAFRFAIADATLVASARMFVGLRTDLTAMTNTDPANLIRCLGIGHDAGETTMRLYYHNGVTMEEIDLGANFPVAVGRVYELEVYSIDTSVRRLGIRVMCEASGAKYEKTFVRDIPSWGTAACPVNLMRTNNTTAAAVAIDIMGIEIEIAS